VLGLADVGLRVACVGEAVVGTAVGGTEGADVVGLTEGSAGGNAVGPVG
jgi:hypothetical protein